MNSLGTVTLNKITHSSYDILNNDKVFSLINGKTKVWRGWEKRVYTITFDNMEPQLYDDLETLLRTNAVQTLTMDKDPYGITGGVSCYCTISPCIHSAGSVVQDKANYRVSFTLTCTEINPR